MSRKNIKSTRIKFSSFSSSASPPPPILPRSSLERLEHEKHRRFVKYSLPLFPVYFPPPLIHRLIPRNHVPETENRLISLRRRGSQERIGASNRRVYSIIFIRAR